MANTTSNFNLNKPLENEKVNISTINQNMDIIDTNLKSLSDEIDTVKSNIPSVDGLVSDSKLSTTLSSYAKKSDLPEEYDDTELSNRIQTIEKDYLTSSDKTNLITAIATAKTEAIQTVLGETVDADFDTLQEVAEWIQSDTTNSAGLITRVTNVESVLDNKAETSDIPTKVSELTNDKGYLTSSDIDTSQNHTHSNKSILDKLTQDYIDKIDGIAEGADANVQADWNAVSGDAFIKNKPEFATVATTGSYSDLSGKPTIPTKTSELTNDSGFKTTDNNTTYELTKSGSTITLTGSDGSTTSVADSNTTYTHPDSGVTAGTYRSVNVNTQGHVTGGSNPTVTVAQGGTGGTDAATARTNLGITPANIGAATTSHGTHVTYSTTTPSANGTASVGTATTVSRSDHVHPLQTSVTGSSGSCTGNSATATKATQDESGNNIKTSYASSASLSGNNLLLKSKSGATLSTVDLSGLGGSSSGGTTVYYQSDEPSVSDTSIWIG